MPSSIPAPGLRTLILASFLLLAACGDAGLPLLSGDHLTKQDPQQRWVLVNYWATWCGPCREEIPQLNAIDAAKDVRVIGSNYDQLPADQLKKAVATMGIKFDDLLADSRKLWPHDVPQALPATLVISPQGQIKTLLLGPQTQESLRAAMAAPAANGKSSG